MHKESKSAVRSFLEKPYTRSLVIIVVFVVGALGWLIFDLIENNSIPSHPFTSTKYSFTINFPGNPEPTTNSANYSGFSVVGTSYDSSVKGDGFHVIVYTYPNNINLSKLSQTKLISLLSFEVDGAVTLAVHGTGIISTESTFLGHPTAEIKFTVGSQGGYGRGFYHGQLEYFIYTIGASKHQFENFANSFRFTSS